jgi:cytochrome c
MKTRVLVAGASIIGALMLSPVQASEGLDLAKKSGCLACHSVEKKVVGPAWKDVAAKYKGDGAARSALIAKVKTGGKGNWTEVTGGVPMPPYSPRVADADIETLVDFVLSLYVLPPWREKRPALYGPVFFWLAIFSTLIFVI